MLNTLILLGAVSALTRVRAASPLTMRARAAELGLGLQWTPPPGWIQSWELRDSLQIYACNYSTWLDADFAAQFSLVALDWSNGKELWANEGPMDAEQLLVDQAARLLARRPNTTVFIYRNTVKALSWFRSVREKLADPAYSGFFLHYDAGVVTPGSPRCDTAHSPPICSSLYHDQMQTPQYAVIDDGQNGTCSRPCDSGGVPTGEYLWDLRNKSARAFVLEDLLGPTCLGNTNISGLYLDDYWVDAQEPINPDGNQPPWGYCSHARTGGPSEIEFRCIDDMGLTQEEVGDITAGWKESFTATYNAMDDAGALAYASFNFQSVPDRSSMAGVLAAACNAGNSSAQYTSPLTVLFTTPPACCPANRNTTLLQFDEDLAYFMLVRGPWAWLGYSWTFCAAHYTMPPALFAEYGIPVNTCYASAPGIYHRDFTKGSASFDANTYTGWVTTHSAG